MLWLSDRDGHNVIASWFPRLSSLAAVAELESVLFMMGYLLIVVCSVTDVMRSLGSHGSSGCAQSVASSAEAGPRCPQIPKSRAHHTHVVTIWPERRLSSQRASFP